MRKNIAAIIVSGLCVGFLLGLSRSEVLGNILVPIVTVVMSLIAFLTGLKFSSKENEEQNLKAQITSINAFPIMWLFISLTIGTIPGMLVRNYNLLSPITETKKEQTEEKPKTEPNLEIQKENLTGLYTLTSQVCQDYNLCNLKGLDLICRLTETESPTIEKIINIENFDLKEIENQIKKLCKCN